MDWFLYDNGLHHERVNRGWNKFLRPEKFFITKNVHDFFNLFAPKYTLSLPPKNIRKPYGLLVFLGGRERVH